MLNEQSQVIRRCDKAMFFFLCVLIYIISISSSIMEWAFGLAFIAFLIKREAFLFHNLMEYLQRTEGSSFKKGIEVFFKSFKPVGSSLNLPIAVFLGVAFATIFVSYDPAQSIKGFIFKTLQGALTCFMVMEVVNTRKRLKIFIGVFFISIALTTVNGLYQYITWEGFLRHRLFLDGRITSSFRHANDLGAYLVIALPVLYCLLRFFRLPKKHNQLPGTRRNFLLLLVALVFVYSLIAVGLTYSRGAWLSLSIAFFLMFIKKPKFLVYFFLIFMLFISVFTVKMINERTANIHSTNQGIFTSSTRNVFWQSAWEIIKKRPVLGVGVNAYTEAAKDFDIEWKGYPHNCYLQMLAEMGVVGLAAFLWIPFRLFRQGFSNLKKIQDQFSYNLLQGLLIGFLGFLIHSFFDTFFYSNQLGSLMWIIMGLIVAVQRIELEY